MTNDRTTSEHLANSVDSAADNTTSKTVNLEGETMTTVDQQLATLLRRITKIQEVVEKADTAADNADSDIRDCVNSTIETLTRDICYAGDKALTARDLMQDVHDMLQALKDETYELNTRLTSGAAAPVLEFKTRHRRMLAVLDSNAGCTIEHVAGSLGISVQTVYGYAHELKQLGFPVRIKAKRVWFDGDEARLVECKTFKLDPSDRTGEETNQVKEA